MNKEEIDQLIIDHKGLADSISIKVWQTATHALDLDELKSMAYWGLVQAANRWEEYCKERNYKSEDIHFFKAYSKPRIRGAIYDELRTKDWVSRTIRSRSKMLREAGQEQGASMDELVERTGLSEKAVLRAIQGMNRKPVSLESNEYDQDILDSVDVEGSDFANRLMLEVVKEFRNLPLENQVVLALKYHQDLSLRDIALELRMTNTRVSQVHANSVIALHSTMVEIAEEFNA